MSETNGPMTLDPTGAMARLLERVDHIDRVLSRLERLADQAPPTLATAVDAFDDACRRATRAGADPEQRLGRALALLERLTDGPTSQALDTLLDRVGALESLVRTLDQAPKALALLVDLFDEWAARLAAEGIDIEAVIRQGLAALLWLGQRIGPTELERLGLVLQSEALQPHTLAVADKTARALATGHAETCAESGPDRLGPLGLLKALNDPDVQRSLAFAARVARCFGSDLSGSAHRADQPQPRPDSSPSRSDLID